MIGFRWLVGLRRGDGGFDEFFEPFEEVEAEPQDVFESGDRIVVFFLLRSRPRGSSAIVEIRGADLWTMRDGKAARLEIFPQRERALKAAGLSERDYCPAMNAEVARRFVEAIPRDVGEDVEEMLSYVDPEGELHSAIVGGAEGNVYRGHEGFRSWVSDSFESFEEVRNEWSEFRDLGNRVLALGHVKARGRGSGMELDSPMGWVFTVRRGKVMKAEGFLRRAEALKAARRRE